MSHDNIVSFTTGTLTLKVPVGGSDFLTEELSILTLIDWAYDEAGMLRDDRKAFFQLDKKGCIKDIIPPLVAQHILLAHGACLIDNEVCWHEFPHVEWLYGDDDKRALLEAASSNYFLYDSDDCGGMMQTIRHYYSAVTVKQCREVTECLRQRLGFLHERHFEGNLSTFVTADGSVIRYEPDHPRDGSLPFSIGPEVLEQDHILYGPKMGASYNPTVTSHKLVDEVLDTWSDGDEDRKWRMLELAAAPMMGSFIDFSGVGIFYGEGGEGKGTFWHVINKVYPRGFTYLSAKGNVNDILGSQFGMSDFGKTTRLFVDEESPEGAMSNVSLAALKDIATGGDVKAKKKFKNESMLIRGLNIRMVTNHQLQFSQLDAANNAVARRFVLVLFKNILHKVDDNKAIARLDEVIANDPDALSYILNLLMQAVARLHTNRGYTPSKEDDELLKNWLGGLDIIGETMDDLGLDEFGGITGAGFNAPVLYRFNKYEDVLVYPVGYHIYKREHNINKFEFIDSETGEKYRYIGTETELPYGRERELYMRAKNATPRVFADMSTVFDMYLLNCKEGNRNSTLGRTKFRNTVCSRYNMKLVRIENEFRQRRNVFVPLGVRDADGSEFTEDDYEKHPAAVYAAWSKQIATLIRTDAELAREKERRIAKDKEEHPERYEKPEPAPTTDIKVLDYVDSVMLRELYEVKDVADIDPEDAKQWLKLVKEMVPFLREQIGYTDNVLVAITEQEQYELDQITGEGDKNE